MLVEGRYDAERRAELERELLRPLAIIKVAGVACTEAIPMRAEDLGMDASAGLAETPSDRAATAKTTAENLNMVGLPQWLDRTIISTIATT